MAPFTRRHFLAIGSAAAAAHALAQKIQPSISITLHPEQTLATVPADFFGLAVSGTLPTADTLRSVGESGTLRVTNSPDLAALRRLLDATGWTCFYTLQPSPTSAVEAKGIAEALGSRLDSFAIGSEPDTSSQTTAAWFADWLRMAQAIRTAIPKARFILPETTAAHPEWLTQAADALLTIDESPCAYCGRAACSCVESPNPTGTRPPINAIAHHYVAPENLFTPQPAITALAVAARNAAERITPHFPPPPSVRGSQAPDVLRMRLPRPDTVPYRVTNVSVPAVLENTYAAALWAADYALQLASLGYAGLNLHFTAPRLSPALLTGLQFAQRFLHARMVALGFDPGAVNASAYAAELPTGQRIVAVINKDATRPLRIDVPTFTTALLLRSEGASAALTEPGGNRETSTILPLSAVLLESSVG